MTSFLEENSVVLDRSYLEWVANDLHITSDPRLEIRILHEDERGIFTTEKIPKDTTIAKIPFQSLLTIYSAQSIPELQTWVDHPQVREDDLLTILLLHHQALGTASLWHQHIRLLPKQYHSIINYSNEELEKIKGSNLYVIAMRWKEQVREDYEQLLSFLNEQVSMSEKRDSYEAVQSQKAFFESLNLTHERYVWGLSCIWSRFISLTYHHQRIIRAMVPFIDLLNHSNDAKIGHQLQLSENVFHVFTAEKVDRNEEMFLNYGNVTNSRLLMLYGFTLFKNPYDSVMIYATMNSNEENNNSNSNSDYSRSSISRASLKNEQLIIHKLKCKILENHKIVFQASSSQNQQHPVSFPLLYNQFPNELLIFLRLQHVANHDLRTRFSWVNENIHQFLSKENELAALRNLSEVLRGMYNDYLQPIEKDEEELRRQGWFISPSPAPSEGMSSSEIKPWSSLRAATTQFIPPKHHHIHSTILTYCEKQILLSIIHILDSKISSFSA